MDSTVIAALITAGGTIGAAIIGVIVATRKQLPDSPRKQLPDPHGEPHVAVSRESPPSKAATESEPYGAASVPAAADKPGMTFDEVIQAILQQQPDAVLGRTAEQGHYFERAKRLTNYQLHTADPPCYQAIQANGKIMWLYLGQGMKICCGDKGS